MTTSRASLSKTVKVWNAVPCAVTLCSSAAMRSTPTARLRRPTVSVATIPPRYRLAEATLLPAPPTTSPRHGPYPPAASRVTRTEPDRPGRIRNSTIRRSHRCDCVEAPCSCTTFSSLTANSAPPTDRVSTANTASSPGIRDTSSALISRTIPSSTGRSTRFATEIRSTSSRRRLPPQGPTSPAWCSPTSQGDTLRPDRAPAAQRRAT